MPQIADQYSLIISSSKRFLVRLLTGILSGLHARGRRKTLSVGGYIFQRYVGAAQGTFSGQPQVARAADKADQRDTLLGEIA
jgi:hypothetical protein